MDEPRSNHYSPPVLDMRADSYDRAVALGVTSPDDPSIRRVEPAHIPRATGLFDNLLDHQKKRRPAMALRKHGEGEVVPDADQQKTAAQNAGMTKEAAEELRRENETADGADQD